VPSLLERGRARIAPIHVGLDGNLIGDRQLSVVERLKSTLCRCTGEGCHIVLASCNSARRAWRARVRRDLTVPTARPSENAISS